jgi:hypothetical protein
VTDTAKENSRSILQICPPSPTHFSTPSSSAKSLEAKKPTWSRFKIIGELLHLSYRSPEHRAALFEVAATFAEVDFEGSVTDPAGRPGISVSFDGEGQRHELIIDPDTGALVAERRTVLDPKKARVEVPPDATPGTIIASAGPPETVVFWRLFMETAVVDSIDSRP